MIDLGISKLAMIGAVALIVIGPDKLPGVARMVGAMIGKAQRYVSDVKAEVNRSMELDEFRKMQESVKSAAKEVQDSVRTETDDFEKAWSDATETASSSEMDDAPSFPAIAPEYQHPTKNWRLKRGATPTWYKARSGVRTKALSGAARVARYRPVKFNT